MIRDSKRKYYDKQVRIAKEKCDFAIYGTTYRMVNRLKSKEAPTQFDIRSIFPGKKDVEIANEAADYFGRISDGFTPLDMNQFTDMNLSLIHI